MANLPHGATARPKTSRQPARLIPQLQTLRIHSTDLPVIVAMLAPKAAERLAKITGLLASDQPDEVVNAATAATRVVSLPGFKRLSPKQLSVLTRVHERVCVGGA